MINVMFEIWSTAHLVKGFIYSAKYLNNYSKDWHTIGNIF